MPLDFAQVKSIYDTSRANAPDKFGSMSLNDFVDHARNVAGEDVFGAGRQGLLGRANTAVWDTLSGGLEKLGVPQMTRDVGAGVGSVFDMLSGGQPFYEKKLGEIGQEFPMGAATIAPMLLSGGLGGLLASAGAAGAHTYSETGSGGEAAKSAVTNFALPFLAKGGQRLALGAGETLARKLGLESLARTIGAGAGTTKALAKVGGVGGILGGLTAADVTGNVLEGRDALGGLTPTQYGVTQIAGLLPYELFGALMPHAEVNKPQPDTMFERVLADAEERKRSVASQTELAKPTIEGHELPMYDSPALEGQPIDLSPSTSTTGWSGRLEAFVGPQPFKQPFFSLESKAHTVWGVGDTEPEIVAKLGVTPSLDVPSRLPASTIERGLYDNLVANNHPVSQTFVDKLGVPDGYVKEGDVWTKAAEATVPAQNVGQEATRYSLAGGKVEYLVTKNVNVGGKHPESGEPELAYRVTMVANGEPVTHSTFATFAEANADAQALANAKARSGKFTPDQLPSVPVNKPLEQQRITADIASLASTPPPADPATLLQSVEQTTTVAGKNGTQLRSDVARGKSVENKTSRGDRLDEALSTEGERDKNDTMLQLRLQRETLPDTIPSDVAAIVQGHADLIEREVEGVAKDMSLTPEAKASRILSLQTEHDTFRKALMRVGDDRDKRMRVVEAYGKWRGTEARNVATLGKKLSDAVADKKRKEQNIEKNKAKKVEKKVAKHATMTEVYDQMVVDAAEDPVSRFIVEAAAQAVKGAEGTKEIESLTTKLTTWWAATPREQRTLEAAKKLLFTTAKSARREQVEQGAETFLRTDGTFGASQKKGDLNVFPSMSDAIDYIDAMVPSKDKADYLFSPKKFPDGVRLSKRARTKTVSLSPLDDDFNESYRINSEQTGHSTNGDLSDDFLDKEFMYAGKIGEQNLHQASTDKEIQERNVRVTKARQMAKDMQLTMGKPLTKAQISLNERMRQQTGFFLDPYTGQWRFEFSDHDIRVKTETLDRPELWTTGVPFGELFHHNELLRHYPDMVKTSVVFERANGQPYRASWHDGKVWLVVDNNMLTSSKFWKNVGIPFTLHEVQHAVQKVEGHPMGTSPEMAQDIRATAYNILAATDVLNMSARSQPHLEEYVDYLHQLTPEARAKIVSQSQTFVKMSEYDLYWHAVGEIYARDTEMRARLDATGRMLEPATLYGGTRRGSSDYIAPEQGIVFTHGIHEALWGLEGARGPERAEGVARATDLSSPFARTVTFIKRFFDRQGYDEAFSARTAIEVGRVASLLGEGVDMWTELRGQRATDQRLGMTTKKDGERIIALRALGQDYTPQLAAGVAFHELGEVVQKELAAGTLPPEMARPLQKMLGDIEAASPQDRVDLMRFLHDEVLPKSLRGDDLRISMTAPMNTARANEVMANVFAVLSHTAAHESSKTFGEKLMNLPVSVMQGFRAVGRFIRDSIRSLKSFMGYQSLGNDHGVRLDNENLFQLTKTLNELVRGVSAHDPMIEQVSRVGDLFSGGLARMRDNALVNPVWIQNVDAMTHPVAEFMSLGGVWKSLNEAVDKILPPLNAIDARPELRPLFGAIKQESETLHAHLRRASALLHAVDPNLPLGPHNMDVKNGPVTKVQEDPIAYIVYHDLQRYAQVAGDKAVAAGATTGPTIFDHVANNDPEVSRLLSTLNPTQKADVLEFAARSQELNRLLNEDLYAADMRASARVTGMALMSKQLATTHEQAYETGQRLLSAALDPNPMVLGQVVLGLTQDPVVATTLIQMSVERAQNAKKQYDMRTARPYYVTEQRLKQFQVTYKVRQGNTTGLQSFDTEDQAKTFLASVRSNPALAVIDTAPRDVRKGYQKVSNLEPIIEKLSVEEAKSKSRLEQSLLSLGVAPADVKAQLDQLSFTTAVEEMQKLTESNTMQIGRKFAPGRESLDMAEQQARQIEIYARRIATRDTDLSVMLMKKDPAIYNDATQSLTDLADRSIAAGRIPDNKAQRAVSTMGYLWFVSSNLSNLIVEQSSQLFQLAPKLVEEGAGILKAGRLISKANATMFQYGLDGTLPQEYQQLFNKADLAGRHGQGSWAEADQIIQNETLAGNPRAPQGVLGVGSRLAQLSAKPYQAAVRYNESIALLSAYDHVREKMFKGKTVLSPSEFKQVFDETTRISGLSQASLGKVNRPVALFDQKSTLWRTTASMLYSLQGFTAGLYANAIRQARRGFGQELKGVIGAKERTDAKKAFTMTIGTLVSLAGLAGIPMLTPMMKLVEPLTEKDLQGEVTSFINQFMTELTDAPTGNFASQVAQHGLLHAMGLPVDISQRVTPGGLFGFNSYNGFDKTKLFGPAVAIATNLFSSVQAAEQGDWSTAFQKGLPPIVGHMASIGASGGNIPASKGGVALANPTNWQKVGYTLGLKPRELVAYEDTSSSIKRADEIAKQQGERLVSNAASMVQNNNPNGAIQLLGEEYKKSGTTFNPTAAFERVLNELEKRKFGTEVRGEATLAGSNVWDRLSGRNVPAVQGSALERTMYRDQVKQQVLGKPVDPATYRQSMIIDLLRRRNPNMSTARAGALSGVFQQEGLTEWQKSPFEMLAGVQ